MRSIEARLAKLETGNRGVPIVAWCDDPADVEITVSAMIAEEQITVADPERLLLVHWETAAWTPRCQDVALFQTARTYCGGQRSAGASPENMSAMNKSSARNNKPSP